MLWMTPDGDADYYAQFFNDAHSIDAIMSGVRLALWLSRRPPDLVVPADAGRPLVLLGWPGGSGYERVLMPRHALPESVWPLVDKVAMARLELERLAPELWERLPQIGYERELDHQVNGWWLPEERQRHLNLKAARPTGALLPEGVLEDGARCLVLVDVDDWWAVLSELGQHIYDFGSRLAAGEEVQFLDVHDTSWRARLVGVAARAEVERRFNAKVAQRARSDADSIVVEVHRVQ